MIETLSQFIYPVLMGEPAAYAYMQGSPLYPEATGTATFYRFRKGTVVVMDMMGLPMVEDRCGSRIFGCHIHEQGRCGEGNEISPVALSRHYNVDECEHPYHSGDMPPLFESRGVAWSAFFTERFTPEEVIGLTVIVHDAPDCFTLEGVQHSGNVLACGVIV